MPRKIGRKSIGFDITDAQSDALTSAITRNHIERAAFIRAAIAVAVQAAGIPWPNDYPERGKYARVPGVHKRTE